MLVALVINSIWVISFIRKVKKSAFLSDKLIAQKIYNDCHKLNIGKNVSVYECDYVDSPITCGVFRPKILLPADLIANVGKQKAELIIFHELIHIKNFDILKNYVWMIAKIIYWFNPLVYLGYNRYLEDVELYTDNTVKEKHSKQKILHYSQGLLDVIKLSQGEIRLPTAMPFCKTKIRKRVETMLKPQEKWKVATIVSYVVIAVLIVTCFTTACMKKQETIVEISNEPKAENKPAIIEEPKVEEQKAEQKKEHISTISKNDDGNIIVNIDAEVRLPTISKVPYAKAEHVGYDQQQLERIIETFFGNKDYYDLSTSIKADFQKTIDNYKNMEFDADSLMAQEERLTTEEEFNKFVNAKIKKFEKKRDEAPEERPIIKLDGTDFVDEEYFVCDMFRGEFDGGDRGGMGYFNSEVNKDFKCNLEIDGRYEPISKFPDSYEDDFDAAELDEYQTAMDFMQKTGIEDVELGDVYFTENVGDTGMYRKIIMFTFERKVGQGTVDHTYERIFDLYGDYDNPIWFERIELMVEGDEIISFSWENPMEITEIIDDDVDYYSYEQAIDTLNAFILKHGFYDMHNGRVDEIEFIVDKIDFSLVRAHDKDGNYTVVPAWKFHSPGMNFKISEKGEEEEYFAPGYVAGDYISDGYFTDSEYFMIINAIDGSIIKSYIEHKG